MTEVKDNRIEMEIASRIRQAREKAGLSLSQLGKLIDVTGSGIGHWENARRVPGVPDIIKLASALKISPQYLACLDDNDFIPFALPVLNLEQTINYKKFTPAHLADQIIKQSGVSHLYIDNQLAENISQHTFAIKVQDESMKPNFNLGDHVIIDPEFNLAPNDIVLIKLKNEELPILRQVQQLKKTADNKPIFELVALNSDWPVDRITDPDQYDLIGVMVAHLAYHAKIRA